MEKKYIYIGVAVLIVGFLYWKYKKSNSATATTATKKDTITKAD